VWAVKMEGRAETGNWSRSGRIRKKGEISIVTGSLNELVLFGSRRMVMFGILRPVAR